MTSSRFSVIAIVWIAISVPASVDAQTATTTINTGNNPFAMAVNPATNKIYVANNGSANITVIDGTHNTTTSVNAGIGPVAVAVNPATNKIYVANEGGTVTVIDGNNNSTTSVNAGIGPTAIAVNSATNKIYVANEDGTVTVINGNDNTTASINAGMGPIAVAVNAVTNKIYVANQFSNNVTVVDGLTNSTTTALVGISPVAIAVNPVTNKIYVANQGNNSLSVVNGSNNSGTTVPMGIAPVAVAINPVTNKVYVADEGSNDVMVVDGTSNSTSPVNVGNQPLALAVNIINNRIYVANFNGASVSVIDASNNTVAAMLSTGNSPRALAVDPVTNKIYAANQNDNTVTVVDGASNNLTAVSTTFSSIAAVNPVTNKIYLTNSLNNTVTVVDGASNTSSTITDPNFDYPLAIAVNPITNKIYVANINSSTLTIIDGTNNTTVTVNVGFQPSAVAINPVTNKIYVLQDGGVAVIDGATNYVTTAAASVGIFAEDIAVDPVTNRIYVVGGSSSVVTGTNIIVIDGVTNSVVSLGDSFGVAQSVAINPITNRIYVTHVTPSLDVTVIQADNNRTTINLGNTADDIPYTMAVNPLTNKIYVLTVNRMIVIDGSNNTTTTVNVGIGGRGLTVNPVTNKIYVTKTDRIYGDAVTVVDGATNTILSTILDTVSSNRHAVALNPVTNAIYMPGVDSMLQGELIVSNEQQVQSIPLTTSITPLPNNQFTYPGTLTFNFTTNSSYSPAPPQVENVFFQFDTWQGPWLQASGSAPNFTGTAPALLPGLHVLYAYATDAQQGDSFQAGNGNEGQSSPIVGAIAAYEFLVSPADSSTVLNSSLNSAIFGQPIIFTATVTSGAGTPTGTVTFADGVTLLGTATLDNSGQAILTSPTAGAGTRSIVAYYNGDGRIGASTSAPLIETISLASSSTTVVSSTNPSIYGQPFILTATITPQFSGTPTGTVTFKDGTTVLGIANLFAGRTRITEIVPLSRGAHSITAVYSADNNFTASSSTLTQIVNTATSTATLNASFSTSFRSMKTLTATVTPEFGGTPTGVVSFMDGATRLGTATLNFSSQATFSTNQLTIGKHTLGVVYGGDTNFTGCTSPGVTVYRSPAPRFVP